MSKPNRRQQILKAYALMLETHPGHRITTAALAKQLEVSEAALYRHFPSKAKMLEGLIEFIETSIFSRITRILGEHSEAIVRCDRILWLLLSFAEKNPGFSRLLAGEVLQGETERLRIRMRQFFDRVETQLRQIVREGIAKSEVRPGAEPRVAANLFLAAAEGRVSQYVRSEFKTAPTLDWDQQWMLLKTAVFQGQ